MIESPNARNQMVFCIFHLVLVEVQTNAGYVRARKSNSNLDNRTAGSSCCPQFPGFSFSFFFLRGDAKITKDIIEMKGGHDHRLIII